MTETTSPRRGPLPGPRHRWPRHAVVMDPNLRDVFRATCLARGVEQTAIVDDLLRRWVRQNASRRSKATRDAVRTIAGDRAFRAVLGS